jgi:hypothetical protein
MATSPPVKKKASSEDADEPGLVASELDDLTHAEMLMLYGEVSRAILFAKSIQWKTVASTLLVYLALICLARIFQLHLGLIRAMILGVCLIGPVALMMLIVYQMWQYNEIRRRRRIEALLSSFFRDIVGVKPSLESDVHRYLILTTMIGALVVGTAGTVYALALVLNYQM